MKMKRLNQNISFFDEFYFYVIVIYAGMATPFTYGMSNVSSIIGFLIPIFLTLILLTRHDVHFDSRELWIVIGIACLWILLSSIKYNKITYNDFFIIYNILVGYIMISIYGNRFWLIYEDIIYKLSVIALVGWIVVFVAPEIMRSIMFMEISEKMIEGNNLIFSMTDQVRPLDYRIRNSGFSWEPGRYASMVVVALFINLIYNKFNWRTMKFIVLLGALLSTFSTTGYTAFFCTCVIAYLYNLKNKSSYIILLPFFIVIGIYVLSLDFMGEKIINLSQSDSERIDNIANYQPDDENYTLQRFDGLLVESWNFINDPLLGYGHSDMSNSFSYNSISTKMIVSGGLLGVFTHYGIFIGLLVYYTLYKSSVKLSEFFKYKGKFFFFLLFVLISISYNFFTVPIFMPMWMWALFNQRKYKIARNSFKVNHLSRIR